MKNLKFTVVSLLLVLALSGGAVAGDMNTPRTSTDSSSFTQVLAHVLTNTLMLMF